MSKSGLRRQYKTNDKLELDGAWMNLPDAANEDGSIPGFLLRRASTNNKGYQLAIEKEVANYKGGELTREQNMAIVRKAFFTHCLVGWRSVQNDEGSELMFNIKLAEQLFDDMPDIYAEALVFVNDRKNYKDGALVLQAGN